jgi:hypothetical protein
MSASRMIVLATMALALLGGCGASTPEVDNAERIPNEAPKPADSPVTKPSADAPATKESPKS